MLEGVKNQITATRDKCISQMANGGSREWIKWFLDEVKAIEASFESEKAKHKEIIAEITEILASNEIDEVKIIALLKKMVTILV
jgi:hypothetical protein